MHPYIFDINWILFDTYNLLHLLNPNSHNSQFQRMSSSPYVTTSTKKPPMMIGAAKKQNSSALFGNFSSREIVRSQQYRPSKRKKMKMKKVSILTSSKAVWIDHCRFNSYFLTLTQLLLTRTNLIPSRFLFLLLFIDIIDLSIIIIG